MTEIVVQPYASGELYVLRLYVIGSTERSGRAIETLRHVCDTHLKGRHELEIIDLYRFPEAAARDRIVAVPTLVKLRPGTQRRIIGDLSNLPRLLAGLGLVA